VVAVQRAEVTRIGRDATLGRFIELRDVFGDSYIYARLGRVARRHALAPRWAGPALPQPAHTPASVRARLAPLGKGTWVAPGTVLGSVPGGAPHAAAHFLFEIRPAGAGPIDPRPILQAWRLLGQTEGHAVRGTQPLFGPNADDALIGEILLMSQRQLEDRVLSDPRLRIYACGRGDIAAGRIDRRVLATLDFLLASGIYPTVSALRCGPGSAATPTTGPEHAKGDAMAISAFNGIPVRDRHGPGSLADVAIRRLLTLPAAMRPTQIVGPLSPRATAGTLLERRSTARVDLAFSATGQPQTARTAARHGKRSTEAPPVVSNGSAGGAAAPSASQTDVPLGAAQWRRLMARLSHLAEPHVPSTPTSAAVGDTSGSPMPAAGPLSESLPLLPCAQSAAADEQCEAAASHRLSSGTTSAGLGFKTPPAELAAPTAVSVLGALGAEPRNRP